MTGFISFIVIFSLLVFVHELGHFIAAKLRGVKVREFGFGYPPRLLRLGIWRETEITLNLLPFGGFVKMAEDDPTEPGNLAAKGRGTRALVYSAGALMNVVLAIVLYSVTFMTGALTPTEGPGAGIYWVSPDSPAAEAGMRPGDTIVAINGEPIDQVQEALDLIKAHTGEPIEIVLRRNGHLLVPVTVIPRENPPPNQGAVGVSLGDPWMRKAYPLWEAIPRGFMAAYNSVRGMFYMIYAAIRGSLPLQVSGPIGIYRETAQVAKSGLDQLIEFTAFLSINLFLVNLLPLPALDGGRLIFVLLETVRGGRRIPPEREGLVHAIGFVVLVALMIVVTFMDYMRYYGP